MEDIEVRVEYSQNQADQWLDHCLYGQPYGVMVGEHEHMQAELAKQGMKLVRWKEFDNAKLEHIVIARKI